MTTYVPAEIREIIVGNIVEPSAIDHSHPDFPQPLYSRTDRERLMQLRLIDSASDVAASAQLYHTVRVEVFVLHGTALTYDNNSLERLDRISRSHLRRHVQRLVLHVSPPSVPSDEDLDGSSTYAWTILPSLLLRLENLRDLFIDCTCRNAPGAVPREVLLLLNTILSLPYPRLTSLFIYAKCKDVWDALAQLLLSRPQGSGPLIPTLKSLELINSWQDSFELASRLGDLRAFDVHSLSVAENWKIRGFQNLERLTIQDVWETSADEVIGFLQSHPNIKHIRFRHFDLTAGTWADILRCAATMPNLLSFVPNKCSYHEEEESGHLRGWHAGHCILAGTTQLFFTTSEDDSEAFAELCKVLNTRRSELGMPCVGEDGEFENMEPVPSFLRGICPQVVEIDDDDGDEMVID